MALASRIGFGFAYVLATKLAVTPAFASGQCIRYGVEGIEAPCGPLGGYTIARGLSESGSVAGYYSCIPSAIENAFGWSSGPGVQAITLPPTMTSARGQAVNSAGQVVGWMYNNSMPPLKHAFQASDGSAIDLGLLPGANSAYALAISEPPGEAIVGYSYNTNSGNPPLTAVVWQGSVLTALALPLGPQSVANSVNGDGTTIVGWMGQNPYGSFVAHGFLWQDGDVTDLGIPPGGTTSEAHAISNNGLICGTYRIPDADDLNLIRGWVWFQGEYTDLGVLPGYVRTYALDINDDGTVVGYCTAPGQYDEAFVWRDGVMTRLDDLIVVDSGLDLHSATAINNGGQIVANGTSPAPNDGAVLLTPIPPIPGDFDSDSDADLADWAAVYACLTGPNSPLPAGCTAADFDDDADADLADAAAFCTILTGVP